MTDRRRGELWGGAYKEVGTFGAPPPLPERRVAKVLEEGRKPRTRYSRKQRGAGPPRPRPRVYDSGFVEANSGADFGDNPPQRKGRAPLPVTEFTGELERSAARLAEISEGLRRQQEADTHVPPELRYRHMTALRGKQQSSVDAIVEFAQRAQRFARAERSGATPAFKRRLAKLVGDLAWYCGELEEELGKNPARRRAGKQAPVSTKQGSGASRGGTRPRSSRAAAAATANTSRVGESGLRRSRSPQLLRGVPSEMSERAPVGANHGEAIFGDDDSWLSLESQEEGGNNSLRMSARNESRIAPPHEAVVDDDWRHEDFPAPVKYRGRDENLLSNHEFVDARGARDTDLELPPRLATETFSRASRDSPHAANVRSFQGDQWRSEAAEFRRYENGEGNAERLEDSDAASSGDGSDGELALTLAPSRDDLAGVMEQLDSLTDQWQETRKRRIEREQRRRRDRESTPHLYGHPEEPEPEFEPTPEQVGSDCDPCHVCGSPIVKMSKFCGSCGAKVVPRVATVPEFDTRPGNAREIDSVPEESLRGRDTTLSHLSAPASGSTNLADMSPVEIVSLLSDHAIDLAVKAVAKDLWTMCDTYVDQMVETEFHGGPRQG